MREKQGEKTAADLWLEYLLEDYFYAEIVAARLDEKLQHPLRTDECWIFTAPRLPAGYGIIRTKQVTLPDGRLCSGNYAHRIAFVLWNGRFPDGGQVLHTCDNPPCCNPAHLTEGTQLENMHDMWAKGRAIMSPMCRAGAEHLGVRYTIEDSNTVLRLLGDGLTVRQIMAQCGFQKTYIEKVRRGLHWTVRKAG